MGLLGAGVGQARRRRRWRWWLRRQAAEGDSGNGADQAAPAPQHVPQLAGECWGDVFRLFWGQLGWVGRWPPKPSTDRKTRRARHAPAGGESSLPAAILPHPSAPPASCYPSSPARGAATSGSVRPARDAPRAAHGAMPCPLRFIVAGVSGLVAVGVLIYSTSRPEKVRAAMEAAHMARRAAACLVARPCPHCAR